MPETSAVDSVLDAMLSIGRLMRQRQGGETLEPGTFWLLNNLRCTGALRVTELATKLQLDASTVSRHAQQLEKDGLVERSTDPQDKRAQIVGISAEGKALLEAGLARRKANLVEHFAAWERHDVETLERLLNKLVRTIDGTEDRAPGTCSGDTQAIETTTISDRATNDYATNDQATDDQATDRPVAELEHQ